MLHPERESQQDPGQSEQNVLTLCGGAGTAMTCRHRCMSMQHRKGISEGWAARVPPRSASCPVPRASCWEGKVHVSPFPPFFFHHHHLLPTCCSGQNRSIFSHLLKSSPSAFLLLLHSFFAGRGNSLVKPLDTRIVACSFPGSQIALKLPSEWQFLSSILLKHVFYTYTEKC